MRARFIALLVGVAVAALAPHIAVAEDPARAVADGAAAQLEANYVYPSRAREAAAVLRRNAAAGAYDGARGAALATKLTADVATVLHDKHVRVRYSEEIVPPDRADRATPSPEQRAVMTRAMRSHGYGLGRVAHLPGNVGYVDVRFFPASDQELQTVFDAAMNAVAYSGVLILDLRRNHGGSPDGIARLLSHVLPPKTHLNDFVGRGDGEPPVAESTYTEAVPGPQITAPIYVLISDETFSGGEECAYDLQTLKRATLVGATTGGGANPGGDRRITEHFTIFVPTMRARNPITMTNWEGSGVKPDIAVARDRALATAYGLALETRLHDDTLAGDERTNVMQLRDKLATLSDADILAL